MGDTDIMPGVGPGAAEAVTCRLAAVSGLRLPSAMTREGEPSAGEVQSHLLVGDAGGATHASMPAGSCMLGRAMRRQAPHDGSCPQYSTP